MARFEVKEPVFLDNEVNIRDFGAVADGKTLNTTAFKDAISKCSSLGGGRVVIPSGLWLTGPIVLESNINLHIESGALVMFTPDFSQYPVREIDLNGVKSIIVTSPIFGENLENIAITGEGIFDGSGEYWRPVKKFKMTEGQWKNLVNSGGVLDENKTIWWPNEEALHGPEKLNQLTAGNAPLEEYDDVRVFMRPRLMDLVNCDTILLDGPTFQNSPMWNLHPLICRNVTIRNISVRNPWFSQNGDGLDVESCHNVIVENSTFDVGDDAICLKSGKDAIGRQIGVATENVIIRGCTVYHGHGGFVVGSEMSGGVNNVFVDNCQFIGTDVGLRFKSARERGGTVEDIHVSNIEMINIQGAAIILDLYYEDRQAGVKPKVVEVTEETPEFKQINFENIICRGAEVGIFLRGLPEMPLKDITFNQVDITADSGVVVENSVNHLFNQVVVEDGKGTELFKA